MGCGCKKRAEQNQQQVVKTQKESINDVQNAIKKTVKKYYKQ